MTNAQILTNSINQWCAPIFQMAINSIANQSTIGFFASQLISPERAISSLQQHLAVPYLHAMVSKLPDEIIPNLALDFIQGMVETRVKSGAIEVPFLRMQLGADAFRQLHSICEANFKEYGDNTPLTAAPEVATKSAPTANPTPTPTPTANPTVGQGAVLGLKACAGLCDLGTESVSSENDWRYLEAWRMESG